MVLCILVSCLYMISTVVHLVLFARRYIMVLFFSTAVISHLQQKCVEFFLASRISKSRSVARFLCDSRICFFFCERIVYTDHALCRPPSRPMLMFVQFRRRPNRFTFCAECQKLPVLMYRNS